MSNIHTDISTCKESCILNAAVCNADLSPEKYCLQVVKIFPKGRDDGLSRCHIQFTNSLEATNARTCILQLQNQGTLQPPTLAGTFDLDKFKVWNLSEFDQNVVRKGHELALRIKELIEQSESGSVTADVACNAVQQAQDRMCKVAFAKAETLEKFCSLNSTVLRFVSDGHGGGRVEAASAVGANTGSSALAVGALVRVRMDQHSPEHLWADVFQWSTGRVIQMGPKIVVQFPEKPDWRGLPKNLRVERPGYQYPGLHDATLEHSRLFDQHGFVRSPNPNDCLFRFTGTVNGRQREAAEYGFIHASNKLTPENPFFDVRLTSSNRNISVGLSGPRFFAGNMVGWLPGSIGFHAQEKAVCYIYHGERVTVRVPSEVFGETDRIGCGVVFEDDVAQTVYFTRNGTVIARCALLDSESGDLYPVVAGASPVEFEFLHPSPAAQAGSPQVGPACTLDMLTYVAKYQEDSSSFKSVYVNGDRTPDGKLPVVFYADGYTDTVEIPLDRVRPRKTIKQVSNIEHGFKYVFKFAKENAKITIHGPGTHILRDSLKLHKSCTVSGDEKSTGPNKPQVVCPAGSVFLVRDSTTVRNLQVRSVLASQGGDARNQKRSAVLLQNGTLVMELCDVSSAEGSGVLIGMHGPVGRPGKPGSLRIKDCSIGPCRASGVLVLFNFGGTTMERVVVEDVQEVGLECHASSKVSLDSCKFNTCRMAIAAYHPKLVTATNCEFRQCREVAILHKADDEAKGETCVRMTACAFNGCSVESRGALGQIVLESCIGVHEARLSGGGVVQQQLQPQGEQPAPSNPGLQSAHPQVLGSEAVQTGNFLVFRELLCSKAKEVLALLLRMSFQRHTGQAWDSGSGSTVLDGVLTSNVMLFATEVDKLKAGDISQWDVSLLCRLLRVPCCRPPSYDLRAKVQLVADARNVYSHEAQEGIGAMPTDVFNVKFRHIYDTLTRMLEDMAKIDFPECRAKPLLDELKEWHHKEVEMFQVLDMEQASPLLWKDVVDDFGHIDLGRLPKGEFIVTLHQDRKYKIRAEGRNSPTFKAWKLSDRRQLLLKVYNSIDEEYAKREVDMLQKLYSKTHENIVEYVDSFAHSKSYVIVTEYIEGESLKEWLADIHSQQAGGDRRVPWKEARTLMEQFARGVSVIHDCNIVHRNLKPSNLKLIPRDDGYILKIVDFGVSKYVNQALTTNVTSFQRIMAACSTLYMSPELIPERSKKLKQVSCAMDVWSMGVILYEILTNFTPFSLTGNTTSNHQGVWDYDQSFIIQNIKKGFTTPLHSDAVVASLRRESPAPDPAPMIRVLKKCLEKETVERYKHAREMWVALEEAFKEMERSCELRVQPVPQPQPNNASSAQVGRLIVRVRSACRVLVA
jgi:serine/threonine protein kinase